MLGVSSTTTDWGLTFSRLPASGLLFQILNDILTGAETGPQNCSLCLPSSDTLLVASLVLDCLLASQEQPLAPGWRNWLVTAGLPSTWHCHPQSCPCPRDRHPCGAAHPAGAMGRWLHLGARGHRTRLHLAQLRLGPSAPQPQQKMIQISQVHARATRQTLPDSQNKLIPR